MLAQPGVGARAGVPLHHQFEGAVELAARRFEVAVLHSRAGRRRSDGSIRRSARRWDRRRERRQAAAGPAAEQRRRPAGAPRAPRRWASNATRIRPEQQAHTDARRAARSQHPGNLNTRIRGGQTTRCSRRCGSAGLRGVRRRALSVTSPGPAGFAEDARGLAERRARTGVMIVFSPIRICRPSFSAVRTSSSHTNATGVSRRRDAPARRGVGRRIGGGSTARRSAAGAEASRRQELVDARGQRLGGDRRRWPACAGAFGRLSGLWRRRGRRTRHAARATTPPRAGCRRPGASG